MRRRYYFLGGCFPNSLVDYIVTKSSGPIQNAANVLQNNILRGLDELIYEGVCVINLPFVGSFPGFFSDIYFPKRCERFGLRSTVFGVGFLNIKYLRLMARLYSSLRGGLKCIGSTESVLLVYSAHLPFVIAAVFLRAFKKNLRTCLIIPDLPEYMGGNHRGVFGFLKKIEIAFFYKLARYFDCYVVLTSGIAERLALQQKDFVVVEGIADLSSDFIRSDVFKKSFGKCVFLYTGTLDQRYGIGLLLESFKKLNRETAELWICGEGDARSVVEEAALHDSRIKYFGQVPRDRAVQLQMEADVLVNPRPPDEYTKFSFPSKVLEYMAAGKPLIMFSLEGIPSEYSGYYISPAVVDSDSLSRCMADIFDASPSSRLSMGFEARNFVVKNKTPHAQVSKIIDLIERVAI